MEIEEKIKKLAEKVQLEIKKEEMPIYLETIKKLEKLLANFQKVKLSEKTLPLTRINVGYLTKKDLEKGDKIYLTYLEHSSNFYPWQALAQEKGAKLDFLPLNEKFTIDIKQLPNYIDRNTKIVSFFHVSNSLGIINPVEEITKKIKEINPNCLVVLDACQSISHLPINVNK